MSKEETRVCNICNKEMQEGYCINGGCEYYCSECCLKKQFTDKEIEELSLGEDDSDSYWTAWE